MRNMEFIIGGTNKMDYGITNAGQWNISGSLAIADWQSGNGWQRHYINLYD